MISIERHNPAALGVPTKAYSNGLLVRLAGAELMFTAEQLSRNPDGSVYAPDDVEKQTRRVYERLIAILAEAGMTLDHVVKAQIFITDIADAPVVSKVRDELLRSAPPVSTLVQVSALIKPGCKVAIEVVAARVYT